MRTPLEEQISELGAPDGDAAEARASTTLRHAAANGELRHRFPAPLRWGAAGVALLLLGLTPPGQALAERLGELVGIGDEPTVEQRVGEETDAVVIGSGESPSGTPVELVAFRVEAKTGQVNTAVRTCYAFDLPPEARSTGNCLTEVPSELGDVRLIAAARPLRPESQFVVQGTVSPETASVALTYTGSEGEPADGEVISGALTQDLALQIDAAAIAGMFVAFIPPLVSWDLFSMSGEDVDAIVDGITATGYADDGTVLWSENLGDLPGSIRIEIPSVPGDPLRTDLPPSPGDDSTGAVSPVGSGIERPPGVGVFGVPSPYAHIGSGPAPKTFLERCDRMFARNSPDDGSPSPSQVQFCAIIRATEAGKLAPGPYSKAELRQILKDADVIPPQYESMIP